MYSSEALKVGLVPPEGLTKDEIRAWVDRNCDPDMMGFDGKEGHENDEC